MSSKIIAGAVALVAAFAVNAASIVSFQLNFYCEEGEVALIGKPSPGVRLGKKIRFRNPKLIGHAFPVEIDLDKTRSMEVELIVTRGTGHIAPSLSGRTHDARSRKARFMKFICTDFEFCGEPAAKKMPFTVTKWTNMLPSGIVVSEGDTITIKASFEKTE